MKKKIVKWWNGQGNSKSDRWLMSPHGILSGKMSALAKMRKKNVHSQVESLPWTTHSIGISSMGTKNVQRRFLCANVANEWHMKLKCERRGLNLQKVSNYGPKEGILWILLRRIHDGTKRKTPNT
jgi:hypothetical protein